MSAYVVLARKWRPSQFDDIVGQAPVVRTLSNAIKLERIHHAYLMTGSRGIGKTSIARIFSKVVRCEHRATTDAGLLRSCDECSLCKEITAGNSVDVIEIDGASNNGVDAIREIREGAKFLPSTGQRKIYIIDEVHMLSTAAFNALLKTLEEPPAHVIFIFATTEPHKIPATILGRCQRFDLRRVTPAQIQGRLEFVSQQEGFQAEPAALALVARAGDGSMRDALSLLDQVIAFAGSNITAQAVRESIGLIEGQLLLRIVRAVFERKPLEAIAAIDEAHASGHDLRVLARGLIEYVHAAILAQLGSSHSAAIAVSDEEWRELQKIAALRPLEEAELVFQVLHHGLEWISRSPHPRLVLDVLLVKCASAELLVVPTTTQTTQTASVTSAPAPRAQQQPIPSVGPVAAQTVPVSAAPAAVVTAQKSAEPAAATPVMATEKTWAGFIDFVKSSRPLVATLLENGAELQLPVQDEQLIIGYSSQHAYHREQIQAKAVNDQLATLAKAYFGKHVRIRAEQAVVGETLAGKKEREKTEQEHSAREAALNHPVILEARSLFGGELGPIELKGDHHAQPTA